MPLQSTSRIALFFKEREVHRKYGRKPLKKSTGWGLRPPYLDAIRPGQARPTNLLGLSDIPITIGNGTRLREPCMRPLGARERGRPEPPAPFRLSPSSPNRKQCASGPRRLPPPSPTRALGDSPRDGLILPPTSHTTPTQLPPLHARTRKKSAHFLRMSEKFPMFAACLTPKTLQLWQDYKELVPKVPENWARWFTP